MASDHSFHDVMRQLQKDPNAAADRVFRRFADRLIALADTRLSATIRNKVDAEDVVQSVFRTFFARQAGGQFDVQNWDGLWAILVVITVRKCARQWKRYKAGARNVGLEVGPGGDAGDQATPWEAVDREPTPEEAAQLGDLVERLLAGLSDRERPVLVLRLQGYTVPEISQQTGRSERTVNRTLQEVRDRLRGLMSQTPVAV